MCHAYLNIQIKSVILIKSLKVHTDINQIYCAIYSAAGPYSITEVAKPIKP